MFDEGGERGRGRSTKGRERGSGRGGERGVEKTVKRSAKGNEKEDMCVERERERRGERGLNRSASHRELRPGLSCRVVGRQRRRLGRGGEPLWADAISI